MNIENESYKIEVEDGIIKKLFANGETFNFADERGKCGAVCFTLKSDDIKTMPHEEFESYHERICEYDFEQKTAENEILCRDSKNLIKTQYILEKDALVISAQTENEDISEFAVNLDLNFLGKKGNDYKDQLLPTTPYTSEDGKYMYFIMTRPNGKAAAVIARTECDGWKIKYSPFSFGHYIFSLGFMASFDRAYNGSGRKNIKVSFHSADSISEAFEIVQKQIGVPMALNVLSGGFDGCGEVEILGKADFIEIKSPDGKIKRQKIGEKTELNEFGFYSATPVYGGKRGLNSVLWGAQSFSELFDKSCDSIKKPYHVDDNLCEGGCFLWEMLLNMQYKNHRKYDKTVKEELDIIMAKSENPIPRRTIFPKAQNGFAPYHVYKSSRVQEQFFGVSILLEAYKLYKDKEILEYAISALNELCDNYIKDGMVDIGTDYTTVCCPMITLVDMALFLKSLNDKRYEVFEKTAGQMAEFLLKRGYDFPTEGIVSEICDTEREDGSISCTALALLYYCMHIKNEERYLEFAKDVLTLHRAWTIYTPDARMFYSSFRWWETIWEGDGQGPAICAGHSWTIWKAEALFYMGILTHDDMALINSWNGFITNFSKTGKDGSMYSCYEPDYIRGGGSDQTKKKLRQLAGEDIAVKYKTAHSYPEHKDNSLSRYAWVRAYETWFKTAAVLDICGKTVLINIKKSENGWQVQENISQIYIGKDVDGIEDFADKNNLKVL